MSGKRQMKVRGTTHRKSRLWKYLIITDTDQTEKNYFEGLKNHLPTEARDRIRIEYRKVKTPELYSACRNELMLANADYPAVIMVFDRDEVPDFDEIIAKANKDHILTGWSNPCFEIWMHAYFGEMPISGNSKDCINKFSRVLKTRTGYDYAKNDKDIYKKLIQYGDEKQAIRIAKTGISVFSYSKPSEMDSCTTVWKIVEEITEKASV